MDTDRGTSKIDGRSKEARAAKQLAALNSDASRASGLDVYDGIPSRRIVIRNLRQDDYDLLAQVAASEGRSIEGQARYAIRMNVEPLRVRLAFHTAQHETVPNCDDAFMRSPEVRTAINLVSSAQAKRDSVRRKLAQGSTAVSEADMKEWDGRFSAAVESLHGLVPPHLLRHPTCDELGLDAEVSGRRAQ